MKQGELEALIRGLMPVLTTRLENHVASEFTKQATLVADAVAPLVQRIAELEQQLKAIPAGPQGPRGERGEKGEAGERGERGEKGATGQKGDSGERGPQGERGEAGPAGDRGEVGAAGERGADGLAGRDGRDGLPGANGAPGEKGVDGVDGKDGKDGLDGLGFEDLSMDFDGVRTLTFRFQRGDQTKEFSYELPSPVDDGVYRKGVTYKKGAGVSYGGSWFIAQRETDAVPESPDCGWRLAVKRGRDGRDGKDGAKGEKGDAGERGRDLTQRDFEGKQRW